MDEAHQLFVLDARMRAEAGSTWSRARVDRDRGPIRSRLDIDEAGEVVLRLIDRKGTIRLKLCAAEYGSRLLLLDDAAEPAVHIIARSTATAERLNTTDIALRGTNSQSRVIRPQVGAR